MENTNTNTHHKNTNIDLKKILNDHYLNIFKNHYFDFEGVTNVNTFRYFLVISIVVFMVLSLVSFGLLSFIYLLATFIPSIAIIVRRLRDANLNPWFALITILPFIGLFFVVALCFIEKHHHNIQIK